jgi:hypothetical protein
MHRYKSNLWGDNADGCVCIRALFFSTAYFEPEFAWNVARFFVIARRIGIHMDITLVVSFFISEG